MWAIVGCALLLLVCAGSSAELYTAVAHLEPTLHAEKKIAATLKSFISQERERLDKLEKIATDYERHSIAALLSENFYLANPVNVFLFVKRFTLDWERDMGPILNNSAWNDFIWNVQRARENLPTYEDLAGAVKALMRLQDTYHLDASELFNGNLGGVISGVKSLSVDDCFELAELSFWQKDFYHTVLWAEEALALLGNDKSTKEKHQKILEYLVDSYFMQGYVKHALTLTNELLTLDPGHIKAFNSKLHLEDILEMQGEDGRLNDEEKCPAIQRGFRERHHQSENFHTYEALCRGKTTQKIKDEHKLKCRYVHNNHPLLILSPVKEEEVHLDPWIVLYHDVMSDSEISDIKFLATPKLHRGYVWDHQTGQLEISPYRISKIAWLEGKYHPAIEKINRRIEVLTGLDMSTAENLQVANYGLGGQYEPHFDFDKKGDPQVHELNGTGNRIATYLAYLTDVEAGGATVFPRLGLKLFPKKGSAAFWYNLDKNGGDIYDTLHGACPVLVGVKWVATKWIHERGQEWRRPCSLSPDK